MKTAGVEQQGSSLGVLWQTNLVEQIRDRLLSAIVKGELKPGERLVEVELARRLGVSRGPIREAARLLEQRGFLRSEPRRGFFVRAFSLDDIDAIFELRSCIQLHTAEKVLSRASDDDVKTLGRLFEAIETAAAKKQDPIASTEANFAFHRFLLELTGNPRFVEVYESLIWETRQIATIVNAEDETAGEFFVHHARQVLEALKAKDVQQLEGALRTYLDASRDSLKDFFCKDREGKNELLVS